MNQKSDTFSPFATPLKTFPFLWLFFLPFLLTAWSPALAGNPDIPLMYIEPYLVSPRPMADMYVCWLTSEPTVNSYVEYGTDPRALIRRKAVTHEIAGLMTVDASGQYRLPLKVYQQIVHLEDLQPMTTYYYRAVSEGKARRKETPGYHFRTAPPPGTPVKFILLSDLQLKPQASSTVRMAGQQGADFIVYNGDLVNDPTRAGEWFSLPGTPEIEDRRWFNVMQQTAGGCRLLQYVPIFSCPGNHEIDDQRTMTEKRFARRGAMSLRIYLQLFRPLYPDQEYGPNGRHWYSVDYGDLHLISLSAFRWFAWPAHEKPGWFLFDDIGKGSPQYEWLKEDLITAQQSKYIWVSMHWHMFNRSQATAIPFTQPVPSPGQSPGNGLPAGSGLSAAGCETPVGKGWRERGELWPCSRVRAVFIEWNSVPRGLQHRKHLPERKGSRMLGPGRGEVLPLCGPLRVSFFRSGLPGPGRGFDRAGNSGQRGSRRYWLSGAGFRLFPDGCTAGKGRPFSGARRIITGRGANLFYRPLRAGRAIPIHIPSDPFPPHVYRQNVPLIANSKISKLRNLPDPAREW